MARTFPCVYFCRDGCFLLHFALRLQLLGWGCELVLNFPNPGLGPKFLRVSLGINSLFTVARLRMAEDGMHPPPARPQTNADFRKLLDTPRVDRSGDVPRERKSRKQADAPRPKKKSTRPKPEPEKPAEDGYRYRHLLTDLRNLE